MNRPRPAWGHLFWLVICLVLGAPFLVGGPEIRNLWKAGFFALAGLVFGLVFVRSFRPASEDDAEPGVRVSFTDSTVTAMYGHGETRSMSWAALSKVGITTTDEGPVLEDVFWGLHAGDEVKVVYPGSAVGAQELLAAMQERLHGFDNDALIRAMGSSSHAQFVVWARANDAA